MDAGTDASDVLENRVIPLRLGFVGLVNRSQLDITQRVTIEAARANEAAFFARHAAYAPLADRCSTRVLMARLSALLAARVREARG